LLRRISVTEVTMHAGGHFTALEHADEVLRRMRAAAG
jgi:hypothetical protein